MANFINSIYLLIILSILTICTSHQNQRLAKDVPIFSHDIFGENELIDILPNRLANIGPVFIVRDITKAILGPSPEAIATSWTLAGLGILAWGAQILGPLTRNQFEDDTAGNYLNATSKILGAGIGVVAISNDLNALIRSSYCFQNFDFTSGSFWAQMTGQDQIQGQSQGQANGGCGSYELIEYLANLFAVMTDIFAVLVPPAGPYMAMMATFKTIVRFIYKPVLQMEPLAWAWLN